MPPTDDSSRIWRASIGVAAINAACLAGTLLCLQSASEATGWVSVAGAVWAFGSYGILIKLPEVSAADPPIFQLYFSAGVASCSILVLALTPFSFSFWGFAGASLWISSMMCGKIGIDGIGYGVAVATWGSTTMIVSFLWGTLVFAERPSSVTGAVAALCTLAAGVAGVATAQSGSLGPPEAEAAAEAFLNPAEGRVGGAAARAGAGWLGALGCGLLNGSLMVPFHYFSEERSGQDGASVGMGYIATFATGVAAVQPIFFLLYARVPFRPLPPLLCSELALPGLITGVFWAIGNFESTFATLHLGQAVGYPLTQTCIVVAGLWGALFFGEIRGAPSLLLFSVSVLVIIGGAVLLGMYGK